MIISLSKITLLNLLLLNSSDAGLNNVPAFTPNKLNPGRTSLSAAIDPSDPYANVLEAYQKKKAIVPDSVSIDIPSIPDTTTVVDTTASSTDSMLQAVNEAVNTAIDASNTATEAAAAISTASATAVKASLAKVVTATAATTATATTLEPGKAPTLLQYLSNPSTSITVPSDTKEKLAILKSNLGMTNVDLAVPSVSLPKSVAVGTAATSTTSVDLSSFLDALHLDEYGAWYVTALTAIYALNQKQAGKMEARNEFQQELLEAKTMAEEAANAALIAAEGAKQAKELVKAMEVNGVEKKKNIGEVMLENSKIGELTVLNDLMSKEMKRLKQENESQKNTIASLTKSTTPSSTPTKKSTPVKLEIPLGKSTMPRDPQEEEKILNILKDIDEENAKLQAVASKQKKAGASKTKKATPKASVKKTSKKKKAAKKEKAAPVPEPFFAEEAVEEAAEIIAEVEKEVKAVVEKPVVKKKKKTTPKKRGAAKKPESDDPNPWGSLKESTLKRKTIAQLTDYLNERKVDVEGLSKAELVGTIQKL